MLAKFSEVFPGRYIVRPLSEEDIPVILELYRSNMDYYAATQNNPVSKEDCVHDMTECPPGISERQKYYLGFYQNGELAAVMDFVEGYPNAETVYIGLFMVDGAFHGKGVGTAILVPFLRAMKEMGFGKAALACFESNSAGKKFWTKLGFMVDETVDRKEGEILRRLMKMSRPLDESEK